MGDSDEVIVWWEILETYPNLYWNYPLYVFLHKHGNTQMMNFLRTQEQKLNSLP